MARRQGTYWLGTISADQPWIPSLSAGIAYLRGQLEKGEGGFEHWQVFFITESKQSVQAVARIFDPTIGHWELSRSTAAEAYVWKEDTRVGEPFEFGTRPFRRNVQADWDKIKASAIGGKLDEIPSDIFVRYYRTLQAIAADHCSPIAIERTAVVYVGPTGTGKSHRAWREAGDQAYAKDPRSKFWCGYKGQANVVLDEFRGGIDIAHLLRWLDRYPLSVEVKGSSRPLLAERYWITSNLPPQSWYPELDLLTVEALLRRLEIIEINELVL